MDFDQTNKVIISTLNKAEAKAFVKFLQSEVARHERDIEDAENLIKVVRQKLGLIDEQKR